MIPDLRIFIKDFGGDLDLVEGEFKGWYTPPYKIPNATRADLAVLFRILGYKKGVEVGVEQGAYSEVLLRANPDLHLFGVDAWKAYRGYRDHTNQNKLSGFLENTYDRLGQFLDRVTVVQAYSMDAVRQFGPDLDFVYIDANHSFDYVMQDLIEWSKRVLSGGIVSGHDFAEAHNCQVVEAVHAYTKAHKIDPWFTIHGDVANNEPPSFFWIKP